MAQMTFSGDDEEGRRFRCAYDSNGMPHTCDLCGRKAIVATHNQTNNDVQRYWCSEHVPEVLVRWFHNTFEALAYAYVRAVAK